MQRILILGCCGAGKSTFSRILADSTGLPVIHLDQHYWQPNWEEPSKEEWANKVNDLTTQDQWIMDGNYGGTLDIRIKKADAIIYLEATTVKCLYRVIKRIIKYHGTVRPDMPAGCPERFDISFLHYVAVFNLVKRKAILKKIRKEKKKVIVSDNLKTIKKTMDSLWKANKIG